MKEKIIDFFKNKYLWFFNLFYISVFLKSTTLIIDYPFLHIFEKILRIIAFILMLVRFVIILPELYKQIRKSKNYKIIVTFTIIVFVAVLINTIKVKNYRIITAALVVLSAYKVDLQKLFKNILKMQLILTILVTLSSLLGITQDFIVLRTEGTKRHSLGFSYTTNFAQIILFACYIYIYLKEFNIKKKEIILLQIISLLIYFLTYSKTELIFFELIIAVCLFKNNNFIINKVSKISSIATKIYFLVPIISLILVLLYPFGNVMKKINDMLSNRLEIQNEVITDGNIKLFGSNMKMVGNGLEDILKNIDDEVKYNYIDNEYLQILVINGSIICIAFVGLLEALLIKLDKDKRYKEIIFIYLILLFGVINPRIIELMYSPVLFFVLPTFIEERDR